MELIFLILGILCFIYGGAVFAAMGATSFLWFWPLCGLLNLLVFALIKMLRRRWSRGEEIWLFPNVFVFTSYGLAALIFAGLIAAELSVPRRELPQGLDYVIVLGTQLDDNKVSEELKRRLDAAVDYYGKNRNTCFVLSGGQDGYDRSTEATVMYYYMVSKGVPAKNLQLEFYSVTVPEKIAYSWRIIQAEVKDERTEDAAARLRPGQPVITAPERPVSVGILTSDYNQFRALRIAQKQGLGQVSLFGTPSAGITQLHRYMREAATIFKDRLLGEM